MNRMPNHYDRPTCRPTWQRVLAGVLALTLTMAPLRVGIDATGLAVGFHTAEAGPIADPYAAVRFQPSVVMTGAGIPVVHITAPNPAGISHNRFQRLDVDAPGLVLNNSLTGGGTLLGVQVDGNPNLAGRTAGLILNEVAAAGTVSGLRGPVEVFGDPARVVIANPNGIFCNGCAFINSPRVTLTTGIPRLLAAPGGIAAPIQAGLAADGRIDLIAGRSLVAETADGGHTVAANGAVDSAASIRAANPDFASVAEGYAIDATALGAMSAGTIRVVATTAGLGVRAAAPLAAAAGALVVGANGDLRLHSAYAARDLRLDAAGGASAGAALLAGGDLSIGAGAGVVVAGDVQSGGGIALHAGGDVRLSGAAIASTDLLVRSTGRVEVGDAAAAARLSLLAGTDVRAARTLLAGSDARIEARNIDTREVAAAGTLSMLAGGSLTASGGLQAGHDARLEALNVVATDEVLAGEALTVLAGSEFAAAGRLQAVADVLIEADNVSTADVLAGSRLTLLAASALTASGRLQAGSDLRLEARDLSTADLLAGGTFSSTATRHALGGTTTVLGDASLRTTGELTIGGDLSVGGRLDMAAGSLTNHAVVAAAAAGTLNADTVVNRGTLYGAGIELTASALDNSRGRVLADGSLGVKLGSLVANDGGTLAAGRDLRLEVSGPFAGSGGALAAGGNLNLSLPAVSLDAATAGRFDSGGRFSLDVPGFANAGTWRPSAASVSVRATAAFSNAGDIEVAGDVLATAGTSFDNAGRLFAAGALDLTAPQLSNQGELLAGGNLAVKAMMVNRGAVAAVGNVALSGAALDNAGGRIQSDRNLSIDVAGALDNVGGTLAALGNADLRAGRILNDRAAPTGTVSVSRGRDATLLDGLVLLVDPRVPLSDLRPDHAPGTVLVAGDPALGTADRLVSLPETVRTESSQVHGTAGRILVLGDAAIRAEGPISNRGGEIVAGGSLTLAASALDNGRSADLINGTAVRTDPVDLAPIHVT